MARNDPSPEDIAALEQEQFEYEFEQDVANQERYDRAQAEYELNVAREEAKRKREVEERVARYKREKAESSRNISRADEEEKAEREKELELEFSMFDKSNEERMRREREYDTERTKKEQTYASQLGEKKYTGFKFLDKYLDTADIKSEIKASGKRLAREKEIKKLETEGKITPEYASFLKKQASEKYESEKKPFARVAMETGEITLGNAIKGAGSYLDNQPSRSLGGYGARGKVGRTGGTKKKKGAPGFSSGISTTSMNMPSLGKPISRSQKQQPASMGMGMQLNVPRFGGGIPKPRAPAKRMPSMSVMPKSIIPSSKPSKSATPKFGKSLLTPRDPFGAKKTNPLKGRKKTLW